MTRMGRPTKAAAAAKKRLTAMSYEEMCDRVTDQDVITVHYDGIFRRGHWYEDHMLKLFSECRLVHLTGNEYQVVEFAKKGGA